MQKNNSELNAKSGEEITAFLLSKIRASWPNESLAVAVSGGMDSMALLHAANIVAVERGVRLHAFHVHHGLQDVADSWVEFVQAYCETHQIAFSTTRLDPNTRQNAQSIEDWARQGRYAALAEMAKQNQIEQIWVAQHQDDQIETHLLQKARGAGARGQAAMPASFRRFELNWHRPWLDVSRAQIDAYVAINHVPHIVDPSNSDTRFARNALRGSHQAQPLSETERAEILTAIYAAQSELAAQTEWASQIIEAHAIEARADIGEVSRLGQLELQSYSEDQQAILIRHWLASIGERMPTRAALRELLKQLNNQRIDQHMSWKHGDGLRICRFRQFLIAGFASDKFDSGVLQQLPSEATEYGIDPDKLAKHGLTVSERQGGERLRLHPKRPSVALKLAYQNAEIPPVLRANLPVVYCGKELVYAAGVGMNVDVCVLGGVRLRWSVLKP